MLKNNLMDGVKEDIIERLNDKLGQTYYLCDLGWELTMNENMTGSWYCNAYRAKEEMFVNYMDLFGRIYEYMHDNAEYDENPMLNPELVHCACMIEYYNQVFNAAVFAAPALDEPWDELWNKEIEITKDFIAKIGEALNDVDDDELF